eukprot:3899709-Rhodomonas_salina.1
MDGVMQVGPKCYGIAYGSGTKPTGEEVLGVTVTSYMRCATQPSRSRQRIPSSPLIHDNADRTTLSATTTRSTQPSHPRQPT